MTSLPNWPSSTPLTEEQLRSAPRTVGELRARLAALGAKPGHLQRLLRSWSQVVSLDTRNSKAADFFPKAVNHELPLLGAQLHALARLRSQHGDSDGSSRLLVALHDGQLAESVLLPRDGLCISSQIGCAVGCRFCMTGRDGLQRHLGSAEMVAQVALARSLRSVSKVVFMGMGEPAHNLDNVMEAIELLGTEGNIGHKNLVFSTVGDLRAFERLPQGLVKPALALSLHTTDAQLRSELLPNAPRIDPEELVERAESYARATSYPIQYQWTLIDGVNDSEEELAAIIRLLSGKYAIMNFIPFNNVDGLAYRRPSMERAAEMVRKLHQHGILAKLRQSAGQEVEGACGQLRARAEKLIKRA